MDILLTQVKPDGQSPLNPSLEHDGGKDYNEHHDDKLMLAGQGDGDKASCKVGNKAPSVLDQIVLKKMQGKLDAPYAKETFEGLAPQARKKKTINEDMYLEQTEYEAEKQPEVPKTSSKQIPSSQSKRKNRRKRTKVCHAAIEQLVIKTVSKSCHGENMQHSITEDHEALESKSRAAGKLTKVDHKTADSKSHFVGNPSQGEGANPPHTEGQPTAVGMRFQALNAKAGVMKTSSSLFGMMSKFGERKRHVCKDCGRNFNQLRVLNVHQQMHSIKRNVVAVARDESNEENTDIATSVSECPKVSGCELEGNLEGEEVKGELLVKEIENNSSQSRSCLQEVPEQLVKGVNHVKSLKKKSEKRKPKVQLEPPPTTKLYVCNICKKVFRLPSFLRRHQLVHTGEKPFACRYCGKCFGQKATQQRHEATHGRNKPYACSECGDGFPTSRRLEKHVKEKHSDSSERQEMERPTESPKLKSKASKRLGKHSEGDNVREEKSVHEDKLVHEDKPVETDKPVQEDTPAKDLGSANDPQTKGEAKVYACPICEKLFLQRSHLSRHSMSHTGEKPFRCKECGKGFSQKSTCLRHEKSHTGELPFICTECGNGFAQKSGLQKHRLIHSGERPYKCQFCDSRFTQKTTCQRHERIHTGEKPFVCQQCGKAFGQSTSLERHVKTHMKGNPPIQEKKSEETLKVKDSD